MKKVLFTLIFAIGLFAAVAQNSFNYQAVMRNGSEVIANQDVKLRISLMRSDSVYYQEEHVAKTNAYGNISIAVGEGTPLLGKFSDAPWDMMDIMMRIEADATDSGTYTDMGSMQIQPVPYAMYAAKSATVIQASNTIGDDAIFAVKDSQGNLLFAVYEDGTRFYVDYNEGSKAAKSGFAVAGRSASKGDEELLKIDNSGTIIYVDGESGSKAAKSKFAVAGRSASKSDADNLLTIDADGTKIYIDTDENTNSSKAAKSKFAVAGRSASKDAPENRFSIDNNGAIFYVDIYGDTDANKAAKSKFAVAGRSASKTEPEYEFVIDEYGTIVYVDDINGSKAAKSKFAVAGRSASKAENDYLTIDQDSTRIYINDAETAEGEPSPVAFAIVGKTNNTEMLTIKRDSAIVNTTIMTAEEVETASGEITKVPDNTLASKAYSTGKIYPYFEKTVSSSDAGGLIYTLSPEITYTYYYSENGEYLYLIYKYENSSSGADIPTYNYEYRTCWLVDGNIYSDTAYYSERTNQTQPKTIKNYNSIFPQYADTLKRQWNGQSLLVLLESELTAAGYKVKNNKGENYYYSPDNQHGYIEDFNPDVKSQQNIVTGLYSTDVFKNSLPQFSRLVMEAAGISNGFAINDLQYIGMGVGANENTYGYTLLDTMVTANSIIANEWEQNDGQQLKNKPQSEDDLFSKKHEWGKQSLSAIENMFRALKDGFTVMTSPTEGGSVSGIRGGNGAYLYGDQITLTATPADGYIFSHWNDGSTENPRTITVMGNLTLWANFASLSDTYQLVDLGLTVKWAARNLGASSSTDVGNSYAWGMAEPNADYNLTDPAKRSDAATAMLGNNYRTPTKNEWNELINDCHWQYDEENNYFKVANRSDSSNYIILPITDSMIANYWTSEYPDRSGVTQAYNANLNFQERKYILTAENLSDFDSMFPIRAVENTTRYHVWVNIEGPDNCGTVSGLGIYDPNTTATITATPADGYEFIGWANGSTDTTFSFTVTGDTTITAQFKQNAVKLYVAATGASDSTGTGAIDAPFATIAQAFGQIVALSDSAPNRDYEIIVDGMLSGPQKMEYFDAELQAGAITLCGKTANTTDGINAGWDGKSNLQPSIDEIPGAALTISTSVPITIRNLKIAGGYTSDDTGGGILINKGNVTIEDGTLITENYGSGVYLAYSEIYDNTLTMNGGEISYNKATYGGGVRNENSKFVMKGGYIKNNTASSDGGGVYANGDFEMRGGEISNDTAYQSGGGVYAYTGTINISEGTISQNNASVSGGGIYVFQYGTVNINGATISNNESIKGGGLYITDGGTVNVAGNTQITANKAAQGGGAYVNYLSTLTMNGGSISGNTVVAAEDYAAYGAGILLDVYSGYGEGDLEMGGDAKIDPDNDVYMKEGSKITIISALTNDSVAKITPSSYTGQAVLLGIADEAGTTLEVEASKFSVTPETAQGTNGETVKNWTIDNEGKLEQVTNP